MWSGSYYVPVFFVLNESKLIPIRIDRQLQLGKQSGTTSSKTRRRLLLMIIIYRGQEQHGKGQEAGDKDTGSGREGNGRWEVLSDPPPPLLESQVQLSTG